MERWTHIELIHRPVVHSIQTRIESRSNIEEQSQLSRCRCRSPALISIKGRGCRRRGEDTIVVNVGVDNDGRRRWKGFEFVSSDDAESGCSTSGSLLRMSYMESGKNEDGKRDKSWSLTQKRLGSIAAVRFSMSVPLARTMSTAVTESTRRPV